MKEKLIPLLMLMFHLFSFSYLISPFFYPRSGLFPLVTATIYLLVLLTILGIFLKKRGALTFYLLLNVLGMIVAPFEPHGIFSFAIPIGLYVFAFYREASVLESNKHHCNGKS